MNQPMEVHRTRKVPLGILASSVRRAFCQEQSTAFGGPSDVDMFVALMRFYSTHCVAVYIYLSCRRVSRPFVSFIFPYIQRTTPGNPTFITMQDSEQSSGMHYMSLTYALTSFIAASPDSNWTSVMLTGILANLAVTKIASAGGFVDLRLIAGT